MNTALWIVASLLAAGYLAGAAAMVVLPKERFRAISRNQHYVDEFSPGFITALGAVKVAGAVGLVLPAVTGIAPVLVPVAALGFVLVMTGATTVRIVRREWRNALGDLVFVALSGFVAWGRFVPEPFL